MIRTSSQNRIFLRGRMLLRVQMFLRVQMLLRGRMLLRGQMFLRKEILWLPSLAVLVLLLSRCGALPESLTLTPASGTFASVYSALQKNNCTECHVPGRSGPAAGVTLNFTSQATAFSTLTANYVTATASVGTCGAAKIVTSGDPAKSYLAAVLFDSYNINNFGGVSGCSPFTGHLAAYNLSTAEQTSLLNWITNGALNN